jgi:hypothetical protein
MRAQAGGGDGELAPRMLASIASSCVCCSARSACGQAAKRASSTALQPSELQQTRARACAALAHAQTRARYFEDLYYHVPSGRFHFFGLRGDGPKTYGHTLPVPVEPEGRPGLEDQWLKMGKCASRINTFRQSASTTMRELLWGARCMSQPRCNLLPAARLTCTLLATGGPCTWSWTGTSSS